ncbi:MAG: Na(+)/H(+) antiporter subunit B [Microcystaceae cyanobacterium]
MKWLYLIAGLGFLVKMLWLSPAQTEVIWEATVPIAQEIGSAGGVPNAVSAIIFRNRLYDILFEVIVFTIAIAGAKYLLSDEEPRTLIRQLPDRTSIILAQFGAMIATLVGVELAIRGHLSPGGGFAAGVAGGTAIGLRLMTTAPEQMESLYRRWHAAAWEKISVLAFLALGVLSLVGVTLPLGEMGSLVSGGFIPLFNLLVAIKVALGSWTMVLCFVRYRGLL